MKRLTYQTVGDARHPQHYCHGPGIRKDDLLQRLGKLEAGSLHPRRRPPDRSQAAGASHPQRFAEHEQRPQKEKRG